MWTEWVVVDDASTGLAIYRAGQLDCGPMEFWTVRQHDLEALQKSHPRLQYQDIQSSGGGLLAMRTDQPPFHDVRVRRAISMALDRQALVAALGVQGQLTPAIPPGLVEWSRNHTHRGEDIAGYLVSKVSAPSQSSGNACGSRSSRRASISRVVRSWGRTVSAAVNCTRATSKRRAI